ncbi:MAG TPA: DUF6212 domain-containing protein [Acetobacteraceae bacterium]|nr:DUF6212 domain-containing protein [Acetobacteraceae bacterium]
MRRARAQTVQDAPGASAPRGQGRKGSDTARATASLATPSAAELPPVAIGDDVMPGAAALLEPKHDFDLPTEDRAPSTAGFVELAQFLERTPSARLAAGTRVTIVTNEMVAFHKNGGLGTANSGLIDMLSQRGAALSIIYTARLDLNAEFVRNAIADLRRRGIEFSCLQEFVPADWMNSPRKMSYAIYWLLRRQKPAIVHFNDYLGNGFYTAQARHTGTALLDTVVIVTVHGPTRWALSIDERPMATPDQMEICFLEERTLEFADVVLGVSHHLLEWLRAQGVKLPRHSYVHKNIMPTVGDAKLPRQLLPGQLSEVVFFARQDVRKGFLIMLRAIRALSTVLPQLKFTFLGKFSTINNEHSGAVALDELRNVPNLIDFRHSLDRDGGLRYLRRHGVLAVIPSTDENSPCTVFECIVEGIPFIASAVGGIPELVADADQPAVLFEPTATALASKIQDVMERGVGATRLKFDPPTIAEQLVDGFAALQAEVLRERREQLALIEQERPLVSVVVTHFNRHAMLKQLLATLEQQTYRNFEVVVVDDGSTNTASIAYLNSLAGAKFNYKLTLVRTKNRYLGAARNTGVRRARGDYVKFQDDDNLPLPHEIEYFVRAAIYADADVVTAMARFFREEAEAEEEIELAKFEYFPLGASLPLALTHNEYGDANALVRRDRFLEDGGFTEIYGVGAEDYEFFVKSESLGRKIVFVPEPLFNYRVTDSSMLQNMSIYAGSKRARSGLRPRDQRWLHELIDFVHESTLARDVKSQSWWRAGKRQFGELHRQMMDGAPDSPENINRFLDLAARYGRLEDVIHMVLSQNTLFDSLKWLEGNARRYDESPLSVREFLKTRPRILKFSSFPQIELLAPTDDLPVGWSVVRLEATGLLVHPLSNRVTQVLIPQALPPQTRKVTIKFSHRNALGGKVRMAFNVTVDGVPVAESGWVEVLPGSESTAAVVIDRPSLEPTDLMLLSTIEGVQDYAWAFADHVCIELEPGSG